MKIKLISAILLICMGFLSLCAQTEDAYDLGNNETTEQGGFLDPNRLKINHSVSFGAAGSSTKSIKSQSLYTTMLEYKFVQPVTLNLNFGFPIHSTFNSSANLNTENLQSADYFRDMPFNFSLTWQPTNKFLMRLSVVREPQSYYNGLFLPYHNDFMFSNW